MIYVILILVLYDHDIVVKIVQRIIVKTLTQWWVVLNNDDNVTIENLRNDENLLSNDSLDDNFIIKRMMRLITWLLNIWIV